MRYVMVRMFQGIFILFGVTIITFFLPNLYYSPLYIAALHFHNPRIPHSVLVQWAHQQGLYQPIIVRYWDWLWAALHGNWGNAINVPNAPPTAVIPVSTVLGDNIWRSVWLVVPPTIVSILIAIPIGLTQAIRRNKIYDHTMTTVIFFLYSTPTVLACTLMAYYIAVVAGIGQPTVTQTALGQSGPGFGLFIVHNFSSFFLPYLAIIVLSIGGLTRYMRGSALDTLVQDYVRTARAKGASPTRVLFRHVLRPSVIPLITIVGLSIPFIIGGSLIVEFVFNFPGMGLLTVSAVQLADYPVVMAVTVFTAVLTVIGNLLADIFTAVADPRVRLSEAR